MLGVRIGPEQSGERVPPHVTASARETEIGEDGEAFWLRQDGLHVFPSAVAELHPAQYVELNHGHLPRHPPSCNSIRPRTWSYSMGGTGLPHFTRTMPRSGGLL